VVKFVKINFLAGRSFINDADLQAQCLEWQEADNQARPSQATDVTPASRLVEEVAKGYPLPKTAADYGFAEPGRVSSGALVAMLGNTYSVPIEHVGAQVTVRIHRTRIVIWHDVERLAEHARAPDGAHRRVVNPAHFARLFGRKPRGQVMLYREALLGLGGVAQQYLSELSRRQRARTAWPRSIGGVCAVRTLWRCRIAGRHGVGPGPRRVRRGVSGRAGQCARARAVTTRAYLAGAHRRSVADRDRSGSERVRSLCLGA